MLSILKARVAKRHPKRQPRKLHTQKIDRVARRGPLARYSKKLKGGPFGEKISGKKSRSAEKHWKGGPVGLAVYDMFRGKTGKTFLVQFARPYSAIWCNNIL